MPLLWGARGCQFSFIQHFCTSCYTFITRTGSVNRHLCKIIPSPPAPESSSRWSWCSICKEEEASCYSPALYWTMLGQQRLDRGNLTWPGWTRRWSDQPCLLQRTPVTFKHHSLIHFHRSTHFLLVFIQTHQVRTVQAYSDYSPRKYSNCHKFYLWLAEIYLISHN